MESASPPRAVLLVSASQAEAVAAYGDTMVEPYRADAPATLGANRKHCFACAAILDVRAELCPKCGVRQPVLPGVIPAPQN